MITTSRALALCTVALLLAGCAEKNFRPGSPLAHLNGYNRTYEEIAADDCQKQYGFLPGTTQMQQCVFQLSMARRQADSNSLAASNNMGALGVLMLEQSQRAYAPPPRPITCTTQGIYTTCQ